MHHNNNAAPLGERRTSFFFPILTTLKMSGILRPRTAYFGFYCRRREVSFATLDVGPVSCCMSWVGSRLVALRYNTGLGWVESCWMGVV